MKQNTMNKKKNISRNIMELHESFLTAFLKFIHKNWFLSYKHTRTHRRQALLLL